MAEVRLKNWSVFNDDNGWKAPEIIKYRLSGNAYNHPRFKDGDPVHTSSIQDIINKEDHKEAITFSGTKYLLYPEDVNPEAEKEYPGYYDRLSIK